MPAWSPYRLPRVRRLLTEATRGAEGFTDSDVATDVARLEAAELFWVTPQMSELAFDASADLPEWTPALAWPARIGLLVWEGGLPLALPWVGAPERGFRVNPFGERRPPDVAVDGVFWTSRDDGSIELSPLSRTGVIDDLLAPRWVRAELFPFAAVRFPAHDPVTRENLRGNGAPFAAVVAATWLLMSQPTVADSRPLHDPATSEGSSKPQRVDPRQVTLVDLRRAVKPGREPSGDATDRTYHHRWITRGHWRQQAVGVGRKQRRPTWIPAHLKGPEGAPLLAKEHVNVWRR